MKAVGKRIIEAELARVNLEQSPFSLDREKFIAERDNRDEDRAESNVEQKLEKEERRSEQIKVRRERKEEGKASNKLELEKIKVMMNKFTQRLK